MPRRILTTRFGILTVIAAAAVLLTHVELAFAPPIARGTNRRPKRPVVAQRNTNRPQVVTAGTNYGRILRFKAGEPGEGPEGFMGELKLKPEDDSARRLLKFEVIDNEDFSVEIPHREIDPFLYRDLMIKGLYVSASWDWKEKVEDESKRRPHDDKVLKVLKLDTMELEGEFDKVEGDIVEIKATPMSGVEWPHLRGIDKSKRITHGHDRNRGPRPMRVKLRLMEDISRFSDARGEPLDLLDFREKQKVQATVVYGRPEGILVELKHQEIGQDDDFPPSDDATNGGRQPPRPRRPRGGGFGAG